MSTGPNNITNQETEYQIEIRNCCISHILCFDVNITGSYTDKK